MTSERRYRSQNPVELWWARLWESVPFRNSTTKIYMQAAIEKIPAWYRYMKSCLPATWTEMFWLAVCKTFYNAAPCASFLKPTIVARKKGCGYKNAVILSIWEIFPQKKFATLFLAIGANQSSQSDMFPLSLLLSYSKKIPAKFITMITNTKQNKSTT